MMTEALSAQNAAGWTPDWKRLAFGAATALLLGVLAAALLNIRAMQRSERDALRTRQARSELSRTLSFCEQAEAGAWGYALTGDPRSLSSYRAARASIGSGLQRLRGMIDDPGQQENLARLSILLDLEAGRLAAIVRARRERGPTASPHTLASREASRGAEALRLWLRELRQAEEQCLREREAAAWFSASQPPSSGSRAAGS